MSVIETRRSRSVCEWFRLLVTLASVLWLTLADPFGLNTIADTAKHNVLARIKAPFYPGAGQRHVTAIVLDDKAAEAIPGGYPIPFSAHAQILQRILCAGPAAVFIDFNFRVVRGGEADLERLVLALSSRVGPDGCGRRTPDEIKDGRYAPVFLGMVRAASPCPTFLDATDEKCRAMVPLKMLSDVVTPLDVTDLVSANSYKLRRDATSVSAGLKLSPALATVDAFCLRDRTLSDICRRPADKPLPDLVLEWGYFLSPAMAALHKGGGCDTRSSTSVTFWDRALISLQLLRDGVFGQSSLGDVAHTCTYTDQLSVATVTNPLFSIRDLSELFGGRIVIYGADITALPDYIDTPVQGRLPGLFVHAMAADNLLTRGMAYSHDTGKTVNRIVEAIIAVVIVLTAFALDWQNLDVRRRYAIASLFLVVIVAVAAVEILILDWVPLNVLLLLPVLLAKMPPKLPGCGAAATTSPNSR